MAEWQEVLLLGLALLGLPVNAWTLGWAIGDRLELLESGRNGVLQMISNRDIREALLRVVTCVALLVSGALLTQLPPSVTPNPEFRWGSQACLILTALGTLVVGALNILQHRAITRMLGLVHPHSGYGEVDHVP